MPRPTPRVPPAHGDGHTALLFLGHAFRLVDVDARGGRVPDLMPRSTRSSRACGLARAQWRELSGSFDLRVRRGSFQGRGWERQAQAKRMIHPDFHGWTDGRAGIGDDSDPRSCGLLLPLLLILESAHARLAHSHPRYVPQERRDIEVCCSMQRSSLCLCITAQLQHVRSPMRASAGFLRLCFANSRARRPRRAILPPQDDGPWKMP